MVRYFIISFLTLLCPVSTSTPLQGGQGEKLRCVIIPTDQVLLAVASQPDAPLAFEDAKPIRCIGRTGMDIYRIRNRGTKAIKSFTVAGWSSVGTGYKSGWVAQTPQELLLPGQLAPIKEQEVELLPLTKEIREQLKLSGPMQGVMVLLVVSVEYADGTSYGGEATSKALEEHFENISANDP